MINYMNSQRLNNLSKTQRRSGFKKIPNSYPFFDKLA